MPCEVGTVIESREGTQACRSLLEALQKISLHLKQPWQSPPGTAPRSALTHGMADWRWPPESTDIFYNNNKYHQIDRLHATEQERAYSISIRSYLNCLVFIYYCGKS